MASAVLLLSRADYSDMPPWILVALTISAAILAIGLVALLDYTLWKTR